MNPWLIKRTIDMQKWQRSMEYLGVLAYSGNERGHRIELTMRSGEVNLPLDGYTVRGYFYLGKPENPEAVMPVKGSASGNLAMLDFPAEAYAVGQASVVVCAERTGEQIPLYSGSYTVRNGSAKVILDPSKTIPSLSALLGEIEDMRSVTADGRAQQEQMAEEFAGYQGEIDGIKADLDEINSSIFDVKTTKIWEKESADSTTYLGNTFRFFSTLIPSGAKINQNLEFKHSGGHSGKTLYVEFWEISDAGLSKVKTIPFIIGANTISESVEVQYNFENDGYVALFAEGGAFLATENKNGYIIKNSNADVTTLNTSDIISFSYTPWVDIEYKISNDNVKDCLEKTKVLENFITVGNVGCDYTNIQDALDNAKDSESNHVTILVMPGIYDKFSCGNWSVFNGTSTPLRHVSIIGLDKQNTVIRSDLGDYRFPAAEIRTNGIIKNLIFIATHDAPYEEIESQKRKAYAVHMDMGTQDVLFEDCVFISYQAPAVGIGCYQDVKYHFRSCEMYSYAPTYDDSNADLSTNFSLLANYGGLFCHSRGLDNVTNQRIILDNCRIYSQNGTKGLWITTSGTFENCEMLVTCINTMALNGIDGVKADISSKLTITADSYGNNWEIN